MEIILIYAIIVIALFVSVFMTRRRFGLLGLALAAGSILSSIWGYDIGLAASGFGVSGGPITSAIVLSAVILLPPFVLFFHSHKYKSLIGRVIGASLFAILAIAFLIEPLGHVLVPVGTGSDIYNWVVNNRTLIIGAGLIFAVLDLFLTKPAHPHDKRRKH